MRRTLLILFALLMASALHSLEIEEGRVRLTLEEDSSRFLVALKSSTASDEWVPLLFAQDPRTSGLDVREGNRVYRIGDGGEFRQVAEVTEEGVFYVWTSPTLRVSQRFRFIRSAGSSAVDGIQLDIAVTNLGELTVPVGIRLLLDTYLGEKTNAHFTTPLRPEITREAELLPSSSEAYVRSMPEDGTEGLQVMLSGSEITPPQQVAVANWKRLSDSDWEYVVNEDRNFNRLPYSINDSALLLTYPEQVLDQNDRYHVTVQMGGPASGGYLDPGVSVPVAEDTRDLILDRLLEIIEQIDELLPDPNATAGDVAALREQLQALSDQVPGQ